MAKRFYWLKLNEDFFDEKYVKALRRLPQGDSLAIVYLKMQLKSLKTEGIIKYEGILPDSIAELAMALDEDDNVVRLAVEALVNFGVVERWDDETLYMSAMQQMIGSESDSAARVRRHRALQDSKKELTPKTNAERQRAFRAKQFGEEKPHVPRCEDHDIACNEECNGGVTEGNTEKEKEKEIEIDREKDKKKEKVSALPSEDIEKEFEMLWSLYPRKQGKANALKAYQKARKGHPEVYQSVENGIKAYLAYLKANKTEQKYVAQGSTWFNQQRWLDDYSTGGNGNGNDGKHHGDIEAERVSRGGYTVRKDLFI